MKNLSQYRVIILFIIILVLVLVIINKTLISLELSQSERKFFVLFYSLINIGAFVVLLVFESQIIKRQKRDFKKAVPYTQLNNKELKEFLRHLLENSTDSIDFSQKISEMLHYQNHIFVDTKMSKGNKIEVEATIFNKKGRMIKVEVLKDFFYKH